MQAPLWLFAGISAVVAGIAALADRRRSRRRDLDRVGWVPWPSIVVAAILCTAIGAALALKS